MVDQVTAIGYKRIDTNDDKQQISHHAPIPVPAEQSAEQKQRGIHHRIFCHTAGSIKAVAGLPVFDKIVVGKQKPCQINDDRQDEK